MNYYNIIKLSQHPEFKMKAVQWFHDKWGISKDIYSDSMDKCIENKNVIPEWYIVIINTKIIAGLGVIENDFHNRIDLTPNVCAVYVEEEYRNLGIAGEMLDYVCYDMNKNNIDTLYLVTDHNSFYEKYNWKFLCMVKNNDDINSESRLYIHRFNEEKIKYEN